VVRIGGGKLFRLVKHLSQFEKSYNSFVQLKNGDEKVETAMKKNECAKETWFELSI
jgi:hypothetical protein